MAVIEEIDETSANAEASGSSASKMTAEQRRKLAETFDKELEDELLKLESSGSKYMDGWSEENWEEEMEKHPFFAKEFDGSKELSPMMKGLQDLKYSPEENTPAELAKNYKEDGNFNFKCKKYRLAVLAYTEGLRNANIVTANMEQLNKEEKSDIVTLKAQLITNRAASQYRLGNFRSSLLDCRVALHVLPSHLKAIERAVECCDNLKRYQECMDWCDKGLSLLSSNANEVDKKTNLQNFRATAEKKFREAERNKRKEEAARKKVEREERNLITAIESRGITIKKADLKEDEEVNNSLSMKDIEPCHPAALQKTVHFGKSDDGKMCLVWPVLFLYPEYGESDFIEAFNENDVIQDHLAHMFDQSEPAPWDIERKYRSFEDINVYYEDTRSKSKSKLVKVDTKRPLVEVLSNKNGYPGVIAGTPAFILLAKKSPFEKEFLNKYK